MTRGIKVATTDVRYATKDQVVLDSTKQGSWKIAKPVTLKTTLTRAFAAPVVTQILSEDHNLGYTPTFIAMLETDTGGSLALYNLPYFDSNNSYKVYTDSKKVYASLDLGLTGTFHYTFRIKLLGEKIE